MLNRDLVLCCDTFSRRWNKNGRHIYSFNYPLVIKKKSMLSRLCSASIYNICPVLQSLPWYVISLPRFVIYPNLYAIKLPRFAIHIPKTSPLCNPSAPFCNVEFTFIRLISNYEAVLLRFRIKIIHVFRIAMKISCTGFFLSFSTK